MDMLSFRNSHQRCSVKIDVLKNFANFTGKHLFWSLFLIVADLKACSFIKKRLQHRCFPVKFHKFLKTHILKNERTTSSVSFSSWISLPHVFFSVQTQTEMVREWWSQRVGV